MGPNVIHFSCDLTPTIKPYSSSFMPRAYIQNNQGRGRGYQPKLKADDTLIILDITKTEFYYTLNESFLSRFDMKCFHSLCQLFLFLRFSQFFLFDIIRKQFLRHLRRPFCVCESLSSTIFSMFCSVNDWKQTWKSSFCFFTDGKQHKARELDMITLRNAPRSCMTWLHVTLSARTRFC